MLMPPALILLVAGHVHAMLATQEQDKLAQVMLWIHGTSIRIPYMRKKYHINSFYTKNAFRMKTVACDFLVSKSFVMINYMLSNNITIKTL